MESIKLKRLGWFSRLCYLPKLIRQYRQENLMKVLPLPVAIKCWWRFLWS